MGLLSLIFGSDNRRNLKQVRKIAETVDALADRYKAMSDSELKDVTNVLKGRLEKGETLDEILPDAFAAVREAGDRVLGMRHFFVQIMGGIVLHQGRVAEMSTGEGKTLVATLPAYLNALAGKGVHIVTVNDYLARRDAEWMGKLYKFMGLSVGVVVPGMQPEEKRAAYQCDITYATNNELGFDYLRDNMVIKKSDLVQRPLSFAIVDEVDSILIDEARTPLIISGHSGKSSDLYVKANRFARSLKEDEDYTIDEKDKAVRITDEGSTKAERFFGLANYSDIENSEIVHHIQQALKANYIMKRDSDYIVNDGEVIIVDEFTGRLMIGRRYSDGLHQAIEAKEGVRIQGENKTLATITFQNYFRLYKKLSGMTGTAKTEESEFNSIYGLDVVVIPTNLPNQRVDNNDAIYKTLSGKLKAVVNDIKDCYERKQPVLVGTLTVEKSEELSKLLKSAKIPHHVLNAKNHQLEAEIVAQAGKSGAVTIATNMAGRGTDILLGGNPEFMAKQKLRQEGVSEEILSLVTAYHIDLSPEVVEVKQKYQQYYEEFKKQTDAEKQEVLAAGGLRIIGTERHDSRRIDNQLRGRAGRQGDPGSTIFYISLQDDLARFFGGDSLTKAFDFLKVSEDEQISNGMITKSIENAQKRVEGRNFSVRKHVLEYDDVMNKQREVMYAERNKVLNNESVHNEVLNMFPLVVEEIVDELIDESTPYEEWDIERINRKINERLLPEGSEFLTPELAEKWNGNLDYVKEMLTKATKQAYEDKIVRYRELGIDFYEVERVILLRIVDTKWIDHIDAMDHLRRGIGLRAYGNQDPVIAYKKEGYDMFDFMEERIKEDTAFTLLKVELQKVPEVKSQMPETTTNEDGKRVPVKAGKKVGPNDPCPCGSGLKYKKCCGK